METLKNKIDKIEETFLIIALILFFILILSIAILPYDVLMSIPEDLSILVISVIFAIYISVFGITLYLKTLIEHNKIDSIN